MHDQEHMPTMTGTVCIFLHFFCSDGHTSHRWRDFCNWNPRRFTLRDELSRTHANDDWRGLYFPLLYTETAIPHIVDVISVSDILVAAPLWGIIFLLSFRTAPRFAPLEPEWVSLRRWSLSEFLLNCLAECNWFRLIPTSTSTKQQFKKGIFYLWLQQWF